MELVRKKLMYGKDDSVDEYLVNQVAKFVRFENLEMFGKELKVKDTELEIIMAPNYLSPEGRIIKASLLISDQFFYILYVNIMQIPQIKIS